jgi:hypothetical protein
MKRIAIWAVLAGGVGDMVLTNIFAIPIAIVVIANSSIARLPQDQIGPAYLTALHANPPLYATALALGALASAFGGVIAALLTKHDRVLNGALSAWACLGIDAYSLATHTSGDGLLLEIVLTPVAPLAGALGGYVVAKRRSRQIVQI